MEELVSKKHTITVIGSGYVGMSLSVLLGRGNNHVKILEIDKEKVKKINEGLSTVCRKMVELCLNCAIVLFFEIRRNYRIYN